MKTSKIIKRIEKQVAFFRGVRKDVYNASSGVALGLEIALEIINAENIKKKTLSPEVMEGRIERINRARAIRLARIAEKKAEKSS